ncbi:aminodeoxychorismate synthase component I [Virgibacillus salexigens]|uniref:Para-aminobenzoate synthase component 1 n=1 Tax=Virgibacillus massiliensis TaxID=1462526 RepID=A0A024QDX8_9BACI|nr:aminodeoxychorismate synthase component I [Virgibacillus massiliensis]CDQ40432.1 Para-aminobenzoate synthase component 1 [Virgibacillus massiliensis]
MQPNKTQPFLLFDFLTDSSKKHPLLFKDPIAIIETSTDTEVMSALQSVQAYVDAGYYAAGYLSYEAAPAFESAFHVHQTYNMPLLWFGIFNKPVEQPVIETGNYFIDEWQPTTSVEEYQTNITKIKNHIEDGGTYQVNYTIRLKSNFYGDSLGYYQQLKQAQSANYSAYLNIGSHSILSSSPELFFHLKDGKITTKPMKGTIRRGRSQKEDAELANWLHHSEKNRAENVMIVDLLRNDLGAIAKPGSVQVPQLFTIERYPTVLQMTSTVTAMVEDDIDIVPIFQALFPCGSITGAPKINTTKIIHDVESSSRDVYCGTIGYITPEKEAVFNVPIRTVLIDNSTGDATYGVGGGITWDSNSEDEYEETLTKALFLQIQESTFELLETIKLSNGTFFLLDYHLARIQSSAAYFNFTLDINELTQQLQNIAQTHLNGSYKIRVRVSKNGAILIENQIFSQDHSNLITYATLADSPINNQDIFYYHKTTNRSMYHDFLSKQPQVSDVLLWNDQRELTEFTIGNLVVEMKGMFYTPPIECGLLAGTFRQKLLDEGVIKEKVLHLEELSQISNIWMINSVRQWVPVQMI